MILIDMNMPQSCQDCPAFGTKACDKWDKHKTFSDQRTTRHNDCPLHESNAIEVLQEIRQNINCYCQNVDKAISEDELLLHGMKKAYNNALEIIDGYIEQYKEDAE